MRRLKGILVCAMIGVFGILLLLAFNVFLKDDVKLSGFERKFSIDKLRILRFTRFSHNSDYIAGLSNDSIYIANATSPNFIDIYGYELNKFKTVKLDIPDERIAWKVLRVFVDYPNVYVAEGVTPVIFAKMLYGGYYKKLNIRESFNQLLPFGTDRVALKIFDQRSSQSVLINRSVQDSLGVNSSFTLERLRDGFFCSDGMILYNDSLNQIIYVYAYRNQYYALDRKNFNFLYSGFTIDTIKNPVMDVRVISSENKRLLVNKPILVNVYGATFGDLLLIKSGLKADNEKLELSISQSVVDVYSLVKKEYLSSFYIPTFKGEKMNDFRVRGDKLIVKYDHFLVLYDFKFGL